MATDAMDQMTVEVHRGIGRPFVFPRSVFLPGKSDKT